MKAATVSFLSSMEPISAAQPARDQFAPTTTPILDALRPLPQPGAHELSAAVYFFATSLLILGVAEWPVLRNLIDGITTTDQPLVTLLLLLTIPVSGFLLAAIAHQAGHVVAGWLAGFRTRGVRFTLAPSDAAPAGLDSAISIPLRPLILDTNSIDHLENRLIFLMAGGAAGNAALAILLEIIRQITAPGLITSLALHLASMLSLITGITALLPDVSGRGRYSDGARILMLLRRDARARRWLAIIGLQHALERGEMPRSWPTKLVSETLAFTDETTDTVTGNWIAYLGTTGRQDIASATRYLEEALSVLDSVQTGLRNRIFLEAAVFQAWYRGNPVKAELWVSRISQLDRLGPLHRIRLDAALLWANNKPFDAWEKLGEALRLLQSGPSSSARIFDEKTLLEWKSQMESRMLTRAWRTMYSLSQQMNDEGAAQQH